METIKNYLDNMFARLPKTNQMLKLRNEILMNMEEKYNELKRDGKTENEAIGIVISEFGNIDELVGELGIESGNEGDILQTVTQEEAESYMAVKKESGRFVGIGVVLCILGAAMLVLVNALVEDGLIGKGLSENFNDILGIIALFLLVVPAVGLFIYSGMKLERYKFLQSGFDLPLQVKTMIQQKYNAFASTYTVSLIIGVCLCVLSPIVIFVTSSFTGNASNYGVVIFLMIIAIAVFLFVYYGNIKESFSVLLKSGNFTKEKAEENKVIGAVAAIVWPLAVCIFLISGFVYNKWGINWIIFPVAGILFGMFSSAYNILKGRSSS